MNGKVTQHFQIQWFQLTFREWSDYGKAHPSHETAEKFLASVRARVSAPTRFRIVEVVTTETVVFDTHDQEKTKC